MLWESLVVFSTMGSLLKKKPLFCYFRSPSKFLTFDGQLKIIRWEEDSLKKDMLTMLKSVE